MAAGLSWDVARSRDMGGTARRSARGPALVGAALVATASLLAAPGVDTTPPQVAETVPAAGATVQELTQIEVVFDENVSGVDASDLRVNGTAATGLQVYSPRDYGFSFPEPPRGPVVFTWAPDHGITDLASPPNRFAGLEWSCTLDPSPRTPSVVISEFLADNEHGLRDDFGERSDWIELLNLDTEGVSLEGWYLTDDADQPTKWRLPEVFLPAQGYLLVWASERDLADPAKPLHTSFKLGSNGEYLALLDAAAKVVSAFAPAYPAQQADISYGRDLVDPILTGYYATPTPGSANTTRGLGIAAEPVFSLGGGVYTNAALTVALSAPSGAIRYTTDGTTPTEVSTRYTSPVSVNRTTTIQARVFEAGLLPGPIVLQTYHLLGASTTSFNSNLPLMIIHTAGRGIRADARVPAFVTAIEPFRGRASLRTPPQHMGKAQIEHRGQSSLGFPKKSFNLELNDPAGLDLEAPLLGLPEESDWVLYSPYSDKPFLQNFLAYELHEQMGHYAPRRRFIELFVQTANGRLEYPRDYAGIYLLVEKLKVDNNRVDIARLTPQHTTEPEITGGYMIKKDKDSPGDRNFSTSGGTGFGGQALKYHEPKPREITSAQQNWIRNYLNQFERALYAPDWRTRTGTNHYSHYIDVDSFVDNHWIVEFPKQIDGYRLSNYMHKDRGGKLKMDPIWDWNLSFGNADYLDGANPNGWYYRLIDANAHIWLRRMISGTSSPSGTTGDPDFNQRIADRWSVLRTNILAAPNLLARVDEMAAHLDEAQIRDFAKWPRLGSYIWPNPPLYSQPRTYVGIIANLKNWITQRYNWVDRQFVRAPELSPSGGWVSPGFPVTLTGTTGPILFTLDGTDPRRSGGALDPAARTYLDPVEIAGNTRLMARVRSGNTWSGPAAAAFLVEPTPLVVTELMYHPAPSTDPANEDAGQFEYVELRNTGATALDLRGFEFVGGIQFSFATGAVTRVNPGGRVVLVKDQAAFVSRYGPEAPVAGEFSGSLDNAGERLRLVGSLGEEVQDFRYDPDKHLGTDGLGFALVVADELQPRERWSEASGWRVGTMPGGTPGQPEPTPLEIPRVLVNEVLAHTDPPLIGAIELYNPGPTAAEVGDWYLSDDRRVPKYRIPKPTVIPAGGFVVFTEREFNPTPGVPPSFSLRAAGDEVFLFSGDASGRLTSYVDGFEIGASLNGESIGRHVNSAGETQFVRLASRTLGAPNSAPRVGPIIISELMYRPPDITANGALWDNTEHEFIELFNLSDATVPLYDPNAPTNTWRLRDAVRYTFPTNASMSPGERLLVVGFDPARQPGEAAAFRTVYGLSQGVRLFGPWEGKLGNRDDSVELVQPDVIRVYSTNYVITAVVVDRVAYADTSPWPAGADGLGLALERLPESSHGNDASYWRAAAPTPGQPPRSVSGPVLVRQPDGRNAMPGEMVTFEVQAEQGTDVQFQWRWNGENLLGANTARLVLTNVQPAHTGAYQAVVWNRDAATASRTAELVVAAPPEIVRQPVPLEVTAGEPAGFSVAAAARAPLRYQWRRRGVPVVDATAYRFELPRAEAADAGDYDVLVSDGTMTSTSAVARLSVLVGLAIVQPPVAMIGARGGSVTFSVAVTNAAELPLRFRWLKNGVIIAEEVRRTHVDFLTLHNLRPADVGSYAVTVFSQVRPLPEVTSGSVRLEVIEEPDTDGDGLSDVFERAYRLDPLDSSDGFGDADGDGASNLDEYRAGTDPQDAGSLLEIAEIEADETTLLRFRAVANRTYAVLFSDRPQDGDWRTLAGVPATAGASNATRTVEVTDSTSPRLGSRFYRLVVPGIWGP